MAEGMSALEVTFRSNPLDRNYPERKPADPQDRFGPTPESNQEENRCNGAATMTEAPEPWRAESASDRAGHVFSGNSGGQPATVDGTCRQGDRYRIRRGIRSQGRHLCLMLADSGRTYADAVTAAAQGHARGADRRGPR